MRRRLLILLEILLCAACQGAPGGVVTFLSPLPGSKYIPPRTSLIIKFDRRIDGRIASSIIQSVHGSQSGEHACTVHISDDLRTVTAQPAPAFSPGETVRVQLDRAAAIPVLAPQEAAQFEFTIALPLKDPDRIHALMRQPVFPLSGEPPHLGRHLALGNDTAALGPVNMYIQPYAGTAPGSLFLANVIFSTVVPQYLMILNNDGSPVFSRLTNYDCYDFKVQPNGFITYFDSQAGEFLELDSTYAVVDAFNCGNDYASDPHDLRLLSNGHALIMGDDPEDVDMSAVYPGGDPDATVVGLIVQELDANKQVVFQWRSWDHFSILDATHWDFTSSYIDYVHGNSLELDGDGNILLSCRHMEEVTKINRETGAIMWRLGGKNNQFTFVNDSLHFSYQHAVRRLANGHITMFDNGDFHVPAFSRACEYVLDENALTATLVWQFRHVPDVFGYAMGYVQRLENGNTLIGWGAGNPTVTEVDSSGRTVYEMSFDEGVFSYRAYRFVWGGTPSTVRRAPSPSVYALAQNYPNPFNPSTRITFSIPLATNVKLSVYTIEGQLVGTLVDESREAGTYTQVFDGSRLASGVYLCRLQAGAFISTRKLLLVK